MAVIMTDDWLVSRSVFESRCHESGGDSSMGMACLFGKWWLRTDPNDESVCPHLIRDGYWEAWVSLAFARFVRPGMRVVDCGAHVGWYTLLALARGADRVMAIEPQRDLGLMLRETLKDNGLSGRVDQWFGGVGARWGNASLLRYGRLTGSASFDRHAAEGWTPTDSVEVSVTPLDEVLMYSEWDQVDVVKIDVEGAEAEAWQGMAKTLSKNPLVLLEVGQPRGYDLDALLRQIESEGYPLRVVTYEGGVLQVSRQWVLDNAKDLPSLWLRREA